MRNILLCLTLMVSFTPVMVVGQGDVGHLYEDALKSSQQGKLSEAIIHLKNALVIDPNHLPSRLLMAEVLVNQGNGVVAEIELEYAQAHGVNTNRLLPLFAEAYLLQDKYKQVLDRIKPANRVKTLEAKLAYLRGRAHLGLYQFVSALREFNRALHLNPHHSKAKLGKAQVLIQRDLLEKAGLLIDEVLNSRSVSANAFLLDAKIQQLKGDFASSLTSLNRAITMEPGHLAARLARAGLMMQSGKLDKAEKDVDFILNKIPLEPRAKYLKAIISASKGDNRSAAERTNEVLITLKGIPDSVMQNNPSYFYLAGITSYRLGSYEAAKRFLNKYLNLYPNDLDSMQTLAAIELKTGRPSFAKGILAKANAYFPENPNILSLLGIAYMDMKEYDLAQEYFERVLTLVPGSDAGLTNLARSKIATGNLEDAIADLLAAKSGTAAQIELNLLLADAYSKSRQYLKAIEIYHQLVQTAPLNSRFARLYGAALGLSGDIKGARQWFERALELDSANIEAIIHLARMDLVQGNRDKAITYLEAKAAENPESHELMVELGKTYSRLGEPQAALLWLQKAYTKKNNTHYTLDELVKTLIQTGGDQDAVSILDEFIGHNPADAKAYIMLGRIHQRINQPQKAIEAFTTAAKLSENKSIPLMILAKALSNVDDRKGAINALTKAISLDESYLAGYIELTKLVIEDGDKSFALRLISSVADLSPDTPVAHILRGELYSSLDEFTEAESHFTKALAIGDNRQALSGLYQVYKSQKKETAALPRLQAWLKKYPKDLPVNILLGDAYFSSGRLTDAQKVYGKLLSLYPKSPVVLNNAAEVYFAAGEKSIALDYARKALKGAPKNANFMDTLGWIESRMGNQQAALSLFREALAYDYTNPDIKYHLALTLEKLDRRGEARKLLAEVV
ncbi:MAG: PEP-CTERM system TPR-repeat protein PrsT, partial [Gammaproteobacteria bacterium]|nr:PEP-CTERM system TPR-repeat protein PrsT [Gammaproteobacteria bacterium]